MTVFFMNCYESALRSLISCKHVIPEKKGHLAEKNFITRMLYKKCILIVLLYLNFN